MQDMEIMKSSLEIMEKYLKELKLLQNREKRLVLPIMEKGLNVLFGTITEEELGVRMKLRSFEKNKWALT